MGRVRRDRVLFIALVAMGVLALSLSYVLEPTPYQYVRMRDYGRVRVDPTMHAVDYVIVALRVGGVVALSAGGYLTYRSLRPDRIDESEGQAAYPDDRYARPGPIARPDVCCELRARRCGAITPNRFATPASPCATATAASITRFVDGTRIVVVGAKWDSELRSPANSRNTTATWRASTATAGPACGVRVCSTSRARR
jgi:hypothetical protein